MIEIKYANQYEVADLAGRSVKEARKLFKNELGIPDRATARLNGKRVKGSLEVETMLGECDTLSFARPTGKSAFLIGALLMALVVTGSVFAYGYTTASTTLSATAAGSDFAAISANNSDLPTWTPYGFFKGGISGPKPIFDVNTESANYTGDLTVTVSIANGDDLVTAYRVLAMFITMKDDEGNYVDINEDGSNSSTTDFALLTLGNGAVDLFVDQTGHPNGDMYTIFVKSGYYISNAWGQSGWAGKEAPLLYAEVAQR